MWARINGLTDLLLSNVYGERQLLAELAATTAGAVTGQLELVCLLDNGQNYEFRISPTFEQ